MSNQENSVDVVICGGGLAGLTLALQLKQERESLAITVLEKTVRPIPDATHKVGESTVEIGADYLANVLGLKSYLEEKHLLKLGLRYFYGDGKKPLEQRPELGPSMFSPVPTYQLDRGILENDLRKKVIEAGVNLLEGASLQEIELNKEGKPHTVTFTANGSEETVRANWVADAMGRRRYLQTKLGLKKESPHKASAVWFRLEGKISVDDLVQATNSEWHNRNIEDRYLSTNHLMGHGYWVWLIPLSSGNTSLGIVTQNDIHDFDSYSRSYQTSLEWLEQHEPILAKHIKDREPLDFRKIKNYSYHSKQLFSENRWACVGEAGIFSDPFYSPGSDMIAITNTFTTNLILLDEDEKLTSSHVGLQNKLLLEVLFPDQLSYFTDGYHTFGNTQIAATKFLWDTLYYWRVYAHPFINGHFKDMQFLEMYVERLPKLSSLNRETQHNFRKWAENSESQNLFEHCDLARKRLFIESAITLLTRVSKQEYPSYLDEQLKLFADMKKSIDAHQNDGKELMGFAPFREFFGQLSSSEKRKNQTNARIATIANGRFLYFFRNLYLRLFVAEKSKVHLRRMLRIIYSD